MGLDLNFEVDSRLSEPALIAALQRSGAEITEHYEGEVLAFYQGSGLTVWGKGNDGRHEILSEQAMGATFEVARRCVFRLNNSEYDTCIRDLECFLNAVCNDSGAFFIVSFQLEETMYVNIGLGVQKCE
ncbi:MAG TPA: hypothetical protein VM532_11860 [Burkholderiales bacterium]|nr:hypothetical protein [Burkholderiales bacterium]